MALSFEQSNINQSSFGQSGSLSFGQNQLPKGTGKAKAEGLNTQNIGQNIGIPNLNLEGNILQNAKDDLKTIGADVTTLLGGIIGYDKESRQAIVDTFNTVASDPEKVTMFADAILSTYNLAIDDFGKMPLGEMVGNVITGAWKRPLTATLDVMSLASMAKLKLPKKLKEKLPAIDEADVRVGLAEEVTKDNLQLHKLGNQFVEEVTAIEKLYDSKTISKAMEAVETIGFKNAPKELLPVMQALNKANDTYKQFTAMAGAEMLNDIEFATKELISKRFKIPFSEIDNSELAKSKTYRDIQNIVKEQEIKPLFHLQPKVHKSDFIYDSPYVETNLLKRQYGTIDYKTAGDDFSKKAAEFVNKVITSKSIDSANSLNKKIRDYNKKYNQNVKQVSANSSVFNNKVLNELNRELKKVMLSSGVYLGANILTTTLSILNNFDLNAAVKTFKKFPKFRLIELSEAETPILKLISRFNNKLYRPVASIDKWLENIATEYINNYGLDKARFLQSTVPSKVPTTSNFEAAIKSLVPFGSYPAAALKEVAAHVADKPGKVLFYNQVGKVGEMLNEQAQSYIPGLTQPDLTQAIRTDDKGELVRRSTVVTPIQAANMFLFGEYGDAIQIPIIQFLNKLLAGEGDPNVFEVNGKRYRVENGEIKTNNGSFNLLPSLSFIGRNLLGPVQFYNQVVVPLLSDKYIKDDTKLFNQLVDDSQYANMGMRAKRKVVDNATEKLGKRVLGTYEYDYWEERVPKSVKKKIVQQKLLRRQLDRALQ